MKPLKRSTKILLIVLGVAVLAVLVLAANVARSRSQVRGIEVVIRHRGTPLLVSNQTVVDTGLYGVVRHPMYAATVLLFLSMPLVLSSPLSFLVSLLYLPIIARRIRNEEAVLEQGLDGYADYKKRVKYKMIPWIW